MCPGCDQSIVADQILRQAQAVCPDRRDEAARQRIEIAEQAAFVAQSLAIGFHHAAVHRHAGGGIGLRMGGEVSEQGVERPRCDFRVAVHEDHRLFFAGQQVVDHMIPGPRFAAGLNVVDDDMGPVACRRAGAGDGVVGGAVYQHMENHVRPVERDRGEAERDPALFLMGEDGYGYTHGVSGSPSPAGHAGWCRGHPILPARSPAWGSLRK